MPRPEDAAKVAAEAVDFQTQSGTSIGDLAGVANFTILQPGTVFTPAAGVDSVEATRFKSALGRTFDSMQENTADRSAAGACGAGSRRVATGVSAALAAEQDDPTARHDGDLRASACADGDR